MTEIEAIERIAWAIHGAHYETDAQKGTLRLNRELAEAAWNEMKAIARENPEPPTIPAWRPMTIEQALAELLRGVRKEPVMPNDSGTGWQ